MNSINPVANALLFSFYIHNTGRATTPQQSKDLCSIGGLLQFGHLLSRSDMMCSDQSIEHEEE